MLFAIKKPGNYPDIISYMEVRMENEKPDIKDDDLEIVEIAEFKTSDDTRKRMLRHKQQERKKREKFYGILALFAAGALVLILLGIFVFRLPVVMLCIVLVLETVIAACLYGTKGWIHVLEIIIGTAAGFIFGRLVLMIGGAAIYLGALLALHEIKQLNLKRT